MNDRNKEWNEKSLTAWNQWKSICSICGCSDEYRHTLMIEVANAFQKKLYSVIGNQLDFLFSDNYKTTAAEEEKIECDILPSQAGGLPADSSFYHSEDFDEKNIDKDKDWEDIITTEDADELKPDDEQSDGSDSVEREKIPTDGMSDDIERQNPGKHTEKRFHIDWAHEFDCGIIEKANAGKSPKNYKDHTWECINWSDDPPLKIIRGQLLGHVGIINEIAERFLRNNFPQIWEKQTSLQTPLGTDDEDSGTLEGVYEDKTEALRGSLLDKTDEKCLRKCFHNLFTNDNAAIFLVFLTRHSTLFRKRVSKAIPELQEFVGLSSPSPLYDRLNNIILPQIQTLPQECLLAMSASGACDFLVFLMMEQIRPEKRAFPLLQRVNDGMEDSTGEEN